MLSFKGLAIVGFAPTHLSITGLQPAALTTRPYRLLNLPVRKFMDEDLDQLKVTPGLIVFYCGYLGSRFYRDWLHHHDSIP